MIKKIIILGLLTFASSVYALDKIDVKLSRCIDGDTAEFIRNNKVFKVRFLSIDTPELTKKQPYAQEAAEYTCKRLEKADKIQIEYDIKSPKEDRYHRKLAWIYVDGELLQRELITKGLAVVKYAKNSYKYTLELKQLEKETENKAIGLYSSNLKKTASITKLEWKTIIKIALLLLWVLIIILRKGKIWKR